MTQGWEPGTQYNNNDVVEYKGHRYKIIQPHRSQGDWTPDVTPALWGKIPGGGGGDCHPQQEHRQPQHRDPPTYGSGHQDEHKYEQRDEHKYEHKDEHKYEHKDEHRDDNKSGIGKIGGAVAAGVAVGVAGGAVLGYAAGKSGRKGGKDGSGSGSGSGSD